MANMQSPQLPAEVAKDFELVDWPGPQKKLYFGKFGIVDLETITPKQAESLVKRKFSKIRQKEDVGAKTATKKELPSGTAGK